MRHATGRTGSKRSGCIGRCSPGSRLCASFRSSWVRWFAGPVARTTRLRSGSTTCAILGRAGTLASIFSPPIFWRPTVIQRLRSFHYDRASADAGRRTPPNSTAGRAAPASAMIALAACETNLPDVERLADCAATLSALGHVDEAELLLDVAEIRRGWPRSSSFDTLVEVSRDLADLQAAYPEGLPLDPAAFVFVPPARSPGSATTAFAPDRVFEDVKSVAAGLKRGLSLDGTVVDLDRQLSEIRDQMVDAPPIVSFGPGETTTVRAGRVAWNSLRDFLLRRRVLAYGPTGSGALLRASTRFSRAGLGPPSRWHRAARGPRSRCVRLAANGLDDDKAALVPRRARTGRHHARQPSPSLAHERLRRGTRRSWAGESSRRRFFAAARKRFWNTTC